MRIPKDGEAISNSSILHRNRHIHSPGREGLSQLSQTRQPGRQNELFRSPFPVLIAKPQEILFRDCPNGASRPGSWERKIDALGIW
jgi:hypothetical protein